MMPRASWRQVTILHLSDELHRGSVQSLNVPLSPSPYFDQLEYRTLRRVTYMQENHGRLVRFFRGYF
jgi:hypothetical protein